MSMQFVCFAVGKDPYCIWDPDIRARNVEFLEGLDPDFFDYQVRLHADEIEGENKHRAAIAIRTAYHHAQETFLAMIGATIQAPSCIPAWIHKYRLEQLRDLLADISNNRPVIAKLSGPVGWGTLAPFVHQYVPFPDEGTAATMTKGFSTFWRRLAGDFLNSDTADEYNSIKHGFRVKSGGFRLQFGPEQKPGAGCPSDQMVSLGGSEYGSSFMALERIDDGDKRNIRIQSQSFNWDANQLVARTQLIAMSLQNLISVLRLKLGAAAETAPFLFPEDSAIFETCWEPKVGVTRFSMGTAFTKSDAVLKSKEEILRLCHYPADSSSEPDNEA